MKAKDLEENAKRWLKTQETENERRPNTIKQYTQSLNRFIEFVESNGIEDIDKQTVIAFKTAMKEEVDRNRKNPKPGRTQLKSITTINIRLTTLNRFFTENGEPQLKVTLVENGDENTAKDVLTEKEYQRILEWADKLGKKKIKLILETLTGTGIRISELEAITVESLKTRKAWAENKGKGRTVYIPKQLTKKLKAYCKENGITEGIIFHGKDKSKLLDQAFIRKEMKDIAGKARGIKRDKAHLHNLRKLFARRYADMPNANPYVLPIILGHSLKRLPVTFRYTAPDEETLLKAVDDMEAYYSEPKKKTGKKKRKTRK